MIVALRKWDNIHWFCNDCEVSALNAVNNSLDKDPTSFEVRLEEKMDKALDEITNKLTNKLSSIIEEGKEQIKKSYADAVKDIDENIVNLVAKVSAPQQKEVAPTLTGGRPITVNETHQVLDVVDEYVEREKRKMNLILHNVPEQGEGSFQDRIQKDIDIFKIIINTELDEQNVQVTRAIRLGKYIEGKKRLMLVELKDENVKRDILKKAKILRNSGQWSNVYISPDLTPKERIEGKKL